MPPVAIAFLSAMAILGSIVLLYPLVRALAERIRGRSESGMRDELQNMRDDLRREIDELRQSGDHVGELSERVDFLERLIAKREAERLPPAR